MQHDINIGVDAFQKSDYTNDKYDIGDLNIYNPIYGQNVTLKQNVRDINRLKYLGALFTRPYSALMINYF